MRDTPAVQKMMKALKDYKVNFELIAPVVFDLVTELEGAGICGTTFRVLNLQLNKKDQFSEQTLLFKFMNMTIRTFFSYLNILNI